MNLLITGAFPLMPEFQAELEHMGWMVYFHQQEQDPVVNPERYDAVICNGLFLYQNIEEFKSLKLIQLTSAGYDRVPMDYIQAHGIQIFNARGVYSVPMAEFALCGVLQIYKQSRFFSKNQQFHQWEKHRYLRELADQTVCIIGCGSVGQACAKRFAAFDCQVIGVDLYPTTTEYFSEIQPLNQLNAVLGVSDIVVLTLPLTPETKYLINAEVLANIKPGALLVNIARGGVVDTTALIHALETGRLSGAVLDVFEEEPLGEDSPLWNMENVVVTPHNSFVSEGNRERLHSCVRNNILNY